MLYLLLSASMNFFKASLKFAVILSLLSLECMSHHVKQISDFYTQNLSYRQITSEHF